MARGTRWWLGARWSVILCALFSILIFAPPEARAEPAASKEYQVKAACLLNFLQFVEWPPTAFANADTPLRIGILGEDPFGVALEETVRGETVQNRKLTIQRSRRVEDLKDCQVLFISRSERDRVAGILSELRPRPVLTVSEMDGFARRGGIINLYLAEQKVRFEINPDAARRQGLQISSELLNLGKIVQAEPTAERR